MNIKRVLASAMGATLLVLVQASFAEESFHLHYRLENLSTDEVNHTGTLRLNVYNTSGEDVWDLVASIPAPNRVTYDQRPIGLGDLPDGEQLEVLEQFVVPSEIAQAEPADEQVTWRLEYTNVLGERQGIDVVGQEVQ